MSICKSWDLLSLKVALGLEEKVEETTDARSQQREAYRESAY